MPRPAPPAPAGPTRTRRGRHIRREIERDERVVLLALRHRLTDALRPGPARELAAVLDALERAVTDARDQARRLNDARIARRGDRASPQPGPAPPPALAPHACHGEYVGSFADLAAVGHMALRACPEAHVSGDTSPAALAELALALHLRGALWTLAHAGRIHVFRCRPR